MRRWGHAKGAIHLPKRDNFQLHGMSILLGGENGKSPSEGGVK